jgi:hypothetical protein
MYRHKFLVMVILTLVLCVLATFTIFAVMAQGECSILPFPAPDQLLSILQSAGFG